jgi:hypothetical protein
MKYLNSKTILFAKKSFNRIVADSFGFIPQIFFFALKKPFCNKNNSSEKRTFRSQQILMLLSCRRLVRLSSSSHLYAAFYQEDVTVASRVTPEQRHALQEVVGLRLLAWHAARLLGRRLEDGEVALQVDWIM